MKILVLSKDDNIINGLDDPGILPESILFNKEAQLWAIMEKLTSHSFSLIIIDDDLVKPNSERIIRMIRQLRKNISIIFITSDMSIELGKQISQLGIDFYVHKPIEAKGLSEALFSILRAKTK